MTTKDRSENTFLWVRSEMVKQHVWVMPHGINPLGSLPSSVFQSYIWRHCSTPERGTPLQSTAPNFQTFLTTYLFDSPAPPELVDEVLHPTISLPSIGSAKLGWFTKFFNYTGAVYSSAADNAAHRHMQYYAHLLSLCNVGCVDTSDTDHTCISRRLNRWHTSGKENIRGEGVICKSPPSGPSTSTATDWLQLYEREDWLGATCLLYTRADPANQQQPRQTVH